MARLPTERVPRSRTTVILIFLAVSIASYLAQETHRPISSALIYLIGVLVIGAMRGRRAGILAGIIASIVYSGVIKNPAFEFNEISLDYYVPLIAFNFTALISGTLAGRLKDRAEVAEEARRQLNILLDFSSDLQKAVRIDDVARALGSTVSAEFIREQIRPYVEENVARAATGLRDVIDLAAMSDSSTAQSRFAGRDVDLPAFVDLLSMAVERCDLLEKQAETQARLRSEDLKTAILSSLSHDLRTPIAAISASATSLKRFSDRFTPEVRADMLRTIEQQCARLDRYTAKLLSFGRLQGGMVESQFEPVDVAEILGNAVASARLVGPTHAILKAFPEQRAVVMANPAMLEQVFFNILENAVLYTPAESQISLSMEIGEDSVTVCSRDSGPGVSPQHIEHIFEPFFRSGNSRPTNGQGLGLFIVKGFVEAFGGHIRAANSALAGQGLEISITLPLAKSETEGNVHG
jgi:two-component system, OmpR family, sensor histidine kinase KdpD